DPHRTYEADCTPDTDRRKIPDDIESPFFEDDIGDGIVQCDRRHEKEGIEKHRYVKQAEASQRGRPDQHRRRNDMTNTQHPLRIDPSVRDDPESCRGEYRGYPHRTVNTSDLFAVEMQYVEHIIAQRDQPCPPDKEFQEIHRDQPGFDIHPLKINIYH